MFSETQIWLESRYLALTCVLCRYMDFIIRPIINIIQLSELRQNGVNEIAHVSKQKTPVQPSYHAPRTATPSSGSGRQTRVSVRVT